MSPLISFSVVICTQLLFFLFLAHKKRAFKKITPHLVLKGVTAGVLFGMSFDLLVGKFLGICSYALGFGPLFLIINGALSYGLWLLTLWLLRESNLLSFCAWNIALGLVYEIANYFFPVWSWTFGGSFLYQESIIILVMYCGGAMLVAYVSTIATHTKFRAFTP